MANEERTALLEKANELSLDFPNNIPTEKLKAMIEEASGPKVKEESEEETEVKATQDNALTANQKLRKRIAEKRKKAMKTRVVTITSKDTRDNDVANTAKLSFENQYYGASKVVPLDVPVELEQCLIDVAKTVMIPHHVAEVINGVRTGNSITKRTNKYVISYAE